MQRNFIEPISVLTLSRIYTIFERECLNGYSFSGESHDFWELVYVAEGSIRVSSDDRVYNLSEGDIIFHKPLELHKFTVNCKCGAKINVLSYLAEGEIAEKMAGRVFSLNAEQKLLAKKIFDFSEFLSEIEITERLLDNEKDYYNVLFKNPLKTQLTIGYICELIISLSKSKNNFMEFESEETKLFKKAIEIMKQHLGDSVSVPKLAFSIGTSESTLKRIFDKYAKLSVYKYFLQLKINQATIMLQNGVSVGKTAEELGFSSQNYFSTCYKRETGQNPSQINKD